MSEMHMRTFELMWIIVKLLRGFTVGVTLSNKRRKEVQPADLGVTNNPKSNVVEKENSLKPVLHVLQLPSS